MSTKNKGILCIISAAFFFALMNLFVRLSGDMPTLQKAFFRNAVAVVVAGIMLIKEKKKIEIGKGNGLSLFCRCLFGTVGLLCNFYAVDKIGIADASMLNKLSPFFAVIFSYFLLKEKASKKEWLFVFIAFVGAMFVVKPTFSMDRLPYFLGFFGGLCAGMAYTCVRKLGKNGVKGPIIVFFFSVFSCLAVSPQLIFDFHPMSATQFIYISLAGVSATLAQFSITAAYTFAPAKDISVFDYTQVIFAAALGFIVLGDLPDWLSAIGYVIIIATAFVKWRMNLKQGE